MNTLSYIVCEKAKAEQTLTQKEMPLKFNLRKKSEVTGSLAFPDGSMHGSKVEHQVIHIFCPFPLFYPERDPNHIIFIFLLPKL